MSKGDHQNKVFPVTSLFPNMHAHTSTCIKPQDVLFFPLACVASVCRQVCWCMLYNDLFYYIATM